MDEVGEAELLKAGRVGRVLECGAGDQEGQTQGPWNPAHPARQPGSSAQPDAEISKRPQSQPDSSRSRNIEANPADYTLSLDQANVRGSVRLVGGFESAGVVVLNSATIEGRFQCTDGVACQRARGRKPFRVVP